MLDQILKRLRSDKNSYFVSFIRISKTFSALIVELIEKHKCSVTGDGSSLDNSVVLLDRCLSTVRHGHALSRDENVLQWCHHILHFHGHDVEFNRTEWHSVNQTLNGNGPNGDGALRQPAIFKRSVIFIIINKVEMIFFWLESSSFKSMKIDSDEKKIIP